MVLSIYISSKRRSMLQMQYLGQAPANYLRPVNGATKSISPARDRIHISWKEACREGQAQVGIPMAATAAKALCGAIPDRPPKAPTPAN